MCSKSSVVALFERNKDFLPQVTVYLIITPFIFQKLLQGVDLNKEIDGGHSGVRKLSVFPSVFNNLMIVQSNPSPYGHLYNTDTSLLRRVRLVPEMPKIIHSLPL